MIEQIISRRLQIPLHQVQGTVRLLREGATIPFISRYRKEATGSLDEVQVASVKEWLDRLTELETRNSAGASRSAGMRWSWRTFTCPTNPNAARGPPWRANGAWSRWPKSSWRSSPATSCSRPGGSFRPKCRPRRRPSPGRATSSPNVSRKMSAPATRCAARSPAKASSIRNSSKAKRRKGRNTPTISTPRRPCAASRHTASWPCAAARRRAF